MSSKTSSELTRDCLRGDGDENETTKVTRLLPSRDGRRGVPQSHPLQIPPVNRLKIVRFAQPFSAIAGRNWLSFHTHGRARRPELLDASAVPKLRR